ncbi:MAG: hypothetical protein ACRDJU_07760 [Actinomycetota bacterium]
MHADTDNGAFFSDAQPTKFKIGLFHSTFGCYDIPYGHLTAQGHPTESTASRAGCGPRALRASGVLST